MSKVLIVGEILIDLVENENGFKYSIGGAPFNVAYNMSSLGDEVTFVGQVGDDYFGNFILDKLREKDNLTLSIEKLKDKNTTIALNVIDGKNRKYSFIRKNTADYAYNLNFLNKIDLQNYDLLHLGSLFLSDENSRKAIKELIEKAKQYNIPISFDVNFRPDIFDESDNVFEIYKDIFNEVDLIKFSDEETQFFFKDVNTDREIFDKLNSKCLLISKGSKGAEVLTEKDTYMHNSFKVKIKDTVGAGDSFYSGFLHCYLNLKSSDNDYIHSALEFACACGALTCLKDGAINGYKSEKDVYKFINDRAITKKDFLFFNLNK